MQQTPTAAPLRVSCVMPNRNHAHELRSSLAALCMQTVPFDEIVVVDDASEDDSADVVRSFADRTPGLRLVRSRTRLGVAGAVRLGLEEATGTHAALAGADDRYDTGLSAALREALAVDPGASLVVTSYGERDPGTGELRSYDRSPDRGLWFAASDAPERVTPERFRSLLRRRPVILSANGALARRDALLRLGPYEPDLRWHADWFAIHALAIRHGFVAVPRTLAWFTLAPASFSASGMGDGGAQRRVMQALSAVLRRPENADLRAFLMDAPAAMSPFMRGLLKALARGGGDPGMAAAVLGWWLREAAMLRRPGALLRLREALGAGAARGVAG
jgi:hypothetical protein